MPQAVVVASAIESAASVVSYAIGTESGTTMLSQLAAAAASSALSSAAAASTGFLLAIAGVPQSPSLTTRLLSLGRRAISVPIAGPVAVVTNINCLNLRFLCTADVAPQPSSAILSHPQPLAALLALTQLSSMPATLRWCL